MRTRKSHRNQKRLWKELGREAQRPGTVAKPLELEEEIARLTAMLKAGAMARGTRKALEARLEKAEARLRVRQVLDAERAAE
jgi:hypothetical protein